MLTQGIGAIFGDLFKSGFELVAGNPAPFFKKRGVVFEDFFGQFDVALIAFESNLISAQGDRDIQQALEELYVLVIRADHRSDGALGKDQFFQYRRLISHIKIARSSQGPVCAFRFTC